MFRYQDILDAEIEITRCLLNTVSNDGSWGTADFSDWGPIITVLAVEHLLRCGYTIDDEWVSDAIASERFSIRKSIHYITEKIHEDGSFGADFWDTCRFGCVIIEQKLQSFVEYHKVHNYIVDYVKSGKLQTLSNQVGSHSDWSGPGTYAVCAKFLFLAGDRDLGNEVLSEAIKMQQHNGCFTGKKTKTGDYKIHPIWHTAQMLMVLMKTPYANNGELIDRIVQWIELAQSDNGEYDDFGQIGIYYTAYAILAMQCIPSQPSAHLDAAVLFLLSQNRNGKYGDCGGTVMVADAFGHLLQPNDLSSISASIRMSDAKSIWEENKTLRSEIENLKKENDELENKLSSADIILSKKDAWKLGIWVAIIIFLLGIIAPIIINVVTDKINQPSQVETQSAGSQLPIESVPSVSNLSNENASSSNNGR